MKIYHRFQKDADLLASDFEQAHLVRRYCGNAAIRMYAALRVTGHARTASFVAAFGSALYGHPEAMEAAAIAFERSKPYRAACREVSEAFGAEFIEKELSDRCEELGRPVQAARMVFSAQHRAVIYPTQMYDVSPEQQRKDDAAHKEFVAKRANERRLEALDFAGQDLDLDQLEQLGECVGFNRSSGRVLFTRGVNSEGTYF